MQFQSQENILELKQKSKELFQDEVNASLITIALNKRGLTNPNIWQCYEVSMESKRLYASALSLMCKNAKARKEYVALLEFIEKMDDVFDAVATATICVEYVQNLGDNRR